MGHHHSLLVPASSVRLLEATVALREFGAAPDTPAALPGAPSAGFVQRAVAELAIAQRPGAELASLAYVAPPREPK
jgi:hypothetical protein